MNTSLKQSRLFQSVQHFSRLSITAVFALMFLSLLSLPLAHTAHAAYADAGGNNLPGQLLALINQDRAAQGLPAYVVNSNLSQIASTHSSNMAQAGQAGNIPGEASLSQRISGVGIQATAWGENVGYASSQPDALGGVQVVHKNIMAQQPPNDGSRQNVLSTKFNQIGLGVVIDAKGVVWVTEDFVQAQTPASGGGTTQPPTTGGTTQPPTTGGTTQPPTTGGTTQPPASTDTLRQQLLTLINQDRAAQNLPAYTENTTLSQGAYLHSSKMAQLNQLAHQLPGEDAPGDRIVKEDPQLLSWGENVGYASSQPDAWGGVQVVHKSMMAELPPNDGHRRNLLSSTFTQIGIGIFVDAKGVVWVTEDFVK